MKRLVYALVITLLLALPLHAAQHDMDITTADANTGTTFRAAVNAALQALATLSSGATEPAAPYAYQLWADTTAGVLKQRNAANNGWITLFSLAGTQLATLASPTFTGTVSIPSPFTLGGVSVTSSAAELNILDGVTATAAEINKLAGTPAGLTSTEIGYVDGVTSAIQTQLNAKASSQNPSFTTTAGNELPIYVAASSNGFVVIDTTDENSILLSASPASNYGNGGKVFVKYPVIQTSIMPSSASDTGIKGEIRVDANHIYICTATNTWKRAALSTW